MNWMLGVQLWLISPSPVQSWTPSPVQNYCSCLISSHKFLQANEAITFVDRHLLFWHQLSRSCKPSNSKSSKAGNVTFVDRRLLFWYRKASWLSFLIFGIWESWRHRKFVRLPMHIGSSVIPEQKYKHNISKLWSSQKRSSDQSLSWTERWRYLRLIRLQCLIENLCHGANIINFSRLSFLDTVPGCHQSLGSLASFWYLKMFILKNLAPVYYTEIA